MNNQEFEKKAAKYRRRVRELDMKINENEREIAALEEEIAEHEKKITEQHERIEKLLSYANLPDEKTKEAIEDDITKADVLEHIHAMDTIMGRYSAGVFSSLMRFL